MNEGQPVRLALDQNFPTPLIRAVAAYLPEDVEVSSLHQIDHRLSDLEDRSLLIALRQLGWNGLITNNYSACRSARDRGNHQDSDDRRRRRGSWP